MLGPDDLMAYMKRMGVEGEVVWLQPGRGRTSVSAAEAVGCSVAQIAKSVVVKGGGLYLVVLSGDRRVDLGKVSELVGERVSLASPREVLERLGFPVGGVPPFGHRVSVRTFVDRSVMRFDEVFASGGSEDTLLRIRVNELLRLVGVSPVDVSR